MMTGTIRSDRGSLKKMVSEKLTKHSSLFAKNSLQVKFQDKKKKRKKKKFHFGNKTEFFNSYFQFFFNRPLHIDKYNSLMGSVDMVDQLLEPYEYSKKSFAWFKKMGIHFIFKTPVKCPSCLPQYHCIHKRSPFYYFCQQTAATREQ